MEGRMTVMTISFLTVVLILDGSQEVRSNLHLNAVMLLDLIEVYEVWCCLSYSAKIKKASELVYELHC